MANRMFEMHDLRLIRVRMSQGDSDRAIPRAGTVGERKAAAFRAVTIKHDWLDKSTEPAR